MCEAAAQRTVEDPGLPKLAAELSAEERNAVLASVTLTVAINFIEHLRQDRQTNVSETDMRGTSFRKMTLSKMLRYETAIERNLGGALDRRERLQRRRRGEPVPPPLRVRLTQ